MTEFLGIDTSNYTTSLAIYDSENKTVNQQKQLLPVKKGELGLRQSDAVFHHTKQLPFLMDKLITQKHSFKAVGVSVRPRNFDSSYMPCFLTGEGLAECTGKLLGVPVYKTSHQVGHILAALYSCDKLEFINQRFIAFHVSGGTTDCLYVEPDKNDVIKITQIGTSLDLKAGQAVDRVGLMLGLDFPCGKSLDELSLNSEKLYKIKPTLKGFDCCLSGIENKCRDLKSKGTQDCDIAKFCLDYIKETLSAMTSKAIEKFGNLPVVFAGGVMSNTLIRKELSQKYNGYFAEPQFSCDNATGCAVYAYIKEKQ